MKRTIVASLFVAVSLVADTSWPGVQFAEVRAFAWPDDKVTTAVILPGMALKPGAINKKGSILTPDQTNRLLTAVTGKHSEYGGSRCHIPHNAFVFYDSTKKPVAFVEVCFECLTTRLEPRGAAEFPDVVNLARIFDEVKLPMGAYRNLKAFLKHFQGE